MSGMDNPQGNTTTPVEVEARILTRPPSERHRPSRATWVWIGVAGAAGVATGAGFAPLGWWVATVLGVSGLSLATRRTRSHCHAAAAGLMFGLGLTIPTLSWMSVIHLGAALGLVLAISAGYTVLGVLLHVAGRSRWWPLLGAGAWLVVEFIAARFPFGGFGWLRLGYAMVDSPLAGLLPLVGVAGVSLATSLTGNLITLFIEVRSRRSLAVVAAWAAVLGAATIVGYALPLPPPDRVASVGWVQGGAPGGGVYGLGAARRITTNQTRATLDLAADIASGREPVPDFVVWPESSTDLDPDSDPQTRDLIESALKSIQRPILVGAILNGPGTEQRRTASRWTQPDGRVGPAYIKRSIVPFGEWIPYRDVLLPLIPELRYVGAQSVAGTEPGMLEVKLPDGTPVTLGVLACFDVAFDPVTYDLAEAQLLIVQSNNAMYQGTIQIEQQFAITRARAAELRREILVVTTSGVSGLIDPYGQVVNRDAGPTAATGVVDLPLRTGTTPASRTAEPLELVITLLAATWLATLALASLRRQRPARFDIPADSGKPQPAGVPEMIHFQVAESDQ